MEFKDLINYIDIKISVIKTFHSDKTVAQDLIECYDDMKSNGTTIEETKMLYDDIENFMSEL